MITIDAIGLEAANAQLKYVQDAIAAYQGCYYRGATRDDGQTNAQVMEHLKTGRVRRDLKTISNENADVIAGEWKREVERHLDNMADASFAGKAVPTGNQAARAQSAAGFRAASKVILRMLEERIRLNLTADDAGRLSPAAKVSDEYAKMRKIKFGVSESEVYKATGQLMADVDDANVGQIVLIPGTSIS